MNRNTKDKYRITKTAAMIIKTGVLILLIAACKQPTKEHVPVIEYVYIQYENGAPKEVGILQDSVKQGLWVNFYPTGKVHFLEFYYNGKQTGPQRGFHDNGRIASYHELRGNLNHGKHMTYYRSGRTASESYWINDTIDGISTQYSEDEEKIEQQVEYKNGELVRVIVGVVPPIEE